VISVSSKIRWDAIGPPTIYIYTSSPIVLGHEGVC